MQTPNGDVTISRDDESVDEAATSGDMDELAASGVCGSQGFSVVQVAGRDQVAAWAEPSLVPSCTGSRQHLSALAPRLGSELSLDMAADGSLLAALYSTTSLGADGEEWGEYDALLDLDVLRFGTASAAGQQPFQLSGTILGPYGPVPIAAVGCARRRVLPC